ncbi:MAG TPA: porin [Burkholderiales bacterium]|nr:porin [Burkholderiales bacterium]
MTIKKGTTTMKPLAAALAMAGMMAGTAPAFAAADGFNFYALIDGGIVATSISGGGPSRTEFVTGGYAPNFVGFTAQKSLSSGLKGGFQFEQGFLLNANPCSAPAGGPPSGGCVGTGSRYWFGPDSFANRAGNVYVEGSLGTLRLGTQGNIAFGSLLSMEPRFGSNFGSALAAIDIDGGLGTRDNAALSYTSPSMSGFTGAVSLVASSRTDVAAPISSGWRLAGSYSMGDLGATLAYYNNKVNTTPSTPDANGWILGGKYKFGAFTLKGIFVKQKTVALPSLKTFGAGGAYDLTPDLTLDGGVYQSRDSGPKYKQTTLGFGGQYKITKELSAYGQIAKVKNNDTFVTSFNFAGPTIEPFTLTAGQSANTLNIGLLFAWF